MTDAVDPVPALTNAERDEIGAMWAFRAASEHETAAHYEALARRLEAQGAPGETIESVAAAGRDELRHRGLCAAMANRAGRHVPAFPAPKLRRVAPHDLSEQARVCYEMVAFYCVTESINATLLLRSWEKARDPQTRAALHELLSDEVRHSQLGWGYLSMETGFRDAVGPWLPRMLAAALHDESLVLDPSPSGSPALVAHGLLSEVNRRGVFLEALNDVVLPGLELCRVPTAEARRWASRFG